MNTNNTNVLTKLTTLVFDPSFSESVRSELQNDATRIGLYIRVMNVLHDAFKEIGYSKESILRAIESIKEENTKIGEKASAVSELYKELEDLRNKKEILTTSVENKEGELARLKEAISSLENKDSELDEAIKSLSEEYHGLSDRFYVSEKVCTAALNDDFITENPDLFKFSELSGYDGVDKLIKVVNTAVSDAEKVIEPLERVAKAFRKATDSFNKNWEKVL